MLLLPPGKDRKTQSQGDIWDEYRRQDLFLSPSMLSLGLRDENSSNDTAQIP